MARMKTMKMIDEKITLCEENLRKLKERCDSVSKDLDKLYFEKKELETRELLAAIEGSARTRAEILAFLGSHA